MDSSLPTQSIVQLAHILLDKNKLFYFLYYCVYHNIEYVAFDWWEDINVIYRFPKSWNTIIFMQVNATIRHLFWCYVKTNMELNKTTLLMLNLIYCAILWPNVYASIEEAMGLDFTNSFVCNSSPQHKVYFISIEVFH